MVRKPGKHQKSEQRCQDLGWKVHDCANLLFCAHTLCMNYVTNTFLLVSSSVRSKQLLYFLHGQGQKREPKPTTKKFVEFHNHSPLLTMVQHHACWDRLPRGSKVKVDWYKLLYLEVSLCNLHSSMCDFVPCDQIVQRVYLSTPDKIVADHNLALLEFEDMN